MEVTPSGMVISFKLEQKANVPCPIEVTPSGIVIWVKFEHPLNA